MSEAAAINPIVAANPIVDRKCTARSKSTGKRCTRDAVRGGTVCYVHGGAAPQVQAAARLRLLMAADSVAGALIAIAKDTKQPASARVQAANSVLDRAGLKADSDLVQARVQAIRATVEANNPESGDTLITDIEIRLVGGSQAQVVDVDVEHVNGKVNGVNGKSHPPTPLLNGDED